MGVIAVYGTLKKGYWNYDRFILPALNDGKARFIGTGVVKGYLIGGGTIPFAKKVDSNDSYIEVEVYEINDEKIQKRIDWLEGAYEKVEVEVHLDNGETVNAYLYDGSNLVDWAWANSYEELCAAIEDEN